MPTPATVKIRYKIGSFSVWPYQVVTFADQVTLTWPTTNISNVKVELVGVDGQKSLVTDNVQGTWPLKRGKAVKYAQSQAIDNGAGVATDTGEDIIPPGPTPPRGSDGLSSAFAADPERSFAFGLLPTGTAEYLLYTIDIIDKTASVQVDYPIFLFPNEAPEIVVENSRVQCALWPKVGDRRGPGVRFGQWISYIPLVGFVNPPVVSGLGGKASVVDWLCLRRLVFESRAYNDAISTELATLYDTFEGQAASQAAQNSYWFVLPKGPDNKIRVAIVNGCSEMPPMAMFPARDRGSNWKATGSYCMKVWSWCELPRHYVTPGSIALELYKPSPRMIWTSIGPSAPNGWTISSHRHQVDNNEDATFLLSNSARDFATISPWHGVFGIDWTEASGNPTTGQQHSCFSPTGLFHTLRILAGRLYCYTHSFRWPGVAQRLVAPETDVTHAQICWSPLGKLVVVYTRQADSSIRYVESLDQGGTWTSGVVLFSGSIPAIAIHPITGTEIVICVDGGSRKCYSRPRGGSFALLSTIGSATASEYATFEFSHSLDNMLIGMVSKGSGSIDRLESLDGGGAWTSASVLSGSRSQVATTREARIEWCLFWDGTNWKVSRSEVPGTAFSAPVTVATPSSSTWASIEVSSASDHRPMVILEEAGALKRFVSPNGAGVDWVQE
jgi:hypothetical protein